MPAPGGNMGFSTTDWAALFIFGASALVGTFGKRLVRIIGLAVMPFAFAGLVLSLNHHGSAPGQGPITNNAPSIKLTTLTTKAVVLIFLTSLDRRGCFSMQQLGISWHASYRPGNLLRFWLWDLEPIGILRTNMPNI
jgi:hypothetical protein